MILCYIFCNLRLRIKAAHVQEKIRKGLAMLASRTTGLVAVLCSDSDDMPDDGNTTM